MTRLQRLGLLMILAVVLLLQSAMVEVLAHFSPVHLPVATRILIGAVLVGGGLAWMLESKEEPIGRKRDKRRTNKRR